MSNNHRSASTKSGTTRPKGAHPSTLPKRITRSIVAFSLDHPKRIVQLMVGCALVLALLAALPSLWPQTFPWLNTLQVDTDPENMLSADEPTRQLHNRMKKVFGVYDLLVVGIVNEDHPHGVFNVESLGRIHELTELARTLYWPDPDYPERRIGVRAAELIAPSSVDYITHEGQGTIRFEWLMPTPPATEKEALEIRQRAMSIPLMHGTLISQDGQALCLYLPLTSKDISYRVYDALRDKIATFDGDDQFHITGLPVAEDAFGIEMFIQMAISAPAAMLVIFLLMLAFFRKLAFVTAPMIVALVSVIATMALLVISGKTVHIMSSMIPIFIMPIAVLDAVHILSGYFDSANGQRERRSIVEELMDKLATPMFFTSITTAAGFLSLSLVPIPPVQVFGVFVALGVMLAWLLSISFIPAYILLLNLAQLPRFGPAERGNDSMLGRSMLWFGRCTQRYHYLILAAALLCTALGVYGIMQIRINDNPVRWFGQTHPIRVADAVLNRHFGGTYMAYLTLRPGDMETTLQDYRAELRPRIKAAAAEWALDRHQAALLAAFQTNLDSTEAGSISALLAELSTDVERRLDSADGDDLVLWDAIAGLLEAERQRLQVFKQPEVLEYMLALQTHLLETGIVGKSVSVADFVRTVHRELMSGEADAYRIPDRADAVAQTLVSYQNNHRPEDLWRFVTPDFTMANLWVLLRSGDNRDMKVVMDAVGAFLAAHPPPYHLQHEWFGLTYINVAWQEKMVSGMQQALLSGFLFVLIMMVLLLRSALWGVLAMLPLTLTIGFIYGIIGLVGKDYDMPVAVLSSLALGLAVDFSIHFLVRTRGLYRLTDSWADLVPRAFGKPARAIARNMAVVSVGFLPLLAAPLVPYNTVGILIAAILISSGVATLLLLPVLLKCFESWFFPHRDPRRTTAFGLGDSIFVGIVMVVLVQVNLTQYLDIGWP